MKCEILSFFTECLMVQTGHIQALTLNSNFVKFYNNLSVSLAIDGLINFQFRLKYSNFLDSQKNAPNSSHFFSKLGVSRLDVFLPDLLHPPKHQRGSTYSDNQLWHQECFSWCLVFLSSKIHYFDI